MEELLYLSVCLTLCQCISLCQAPPSLLCSLPICLSHYPNVSMFIYLSPPLFNLSLSFQMASFEQQTFDQRRVGRSFSTNVSKNNQCPKCNLVIFKTEELVAAGAAWHKKCFTVSCDFYSSTVISSYILIDNYLQYLVI